MAEERPFRTSEGEERHGRRDAEVHPDHAHPHPVAELASRPPRGGEDRRGVPIARALDDVDRFVQVAHARDARHRSEDFLPANRHLPPQGVEQRRADEVATRTPPKLRGSSVYRLYGAIAAWGLAVVGHPLP